MDLRLVRTMLFTPAEKPERFSTARETGADGIVIDLEDAVPLSHKDQARQIAINYFKEYKPDPKFICCLRINSIKTAAGLKDISALLDNNVRPDAIMLPKCESASEIKILESLLATPATPFIALIETAEGLYHATEIATASERLQVLVFGGADFAADIGAVLEWEPMLHARTTLICAAATAGIAAFDVPYLNLKDVDDNNLINETKCVRDLGFSGKLAIHPKQIKPILETFTPTPTAVAHAKRIIEIYENSGGHACEIDGKMIDIPVYRSAKRILALVDK